MKAAIKFLEELRSKTIKSGIKVKATYNGWDVTYHPLAGVFAAEQKTKRVIRRNETILAGIIVKD